MLIIIFYASTALSSLMQGSDYLSAFYVAGHLIATGQAARLYPQPGAGTLIGAPFDKAAHELLPHIAANHTAIYMYSPLTAALFAPLGQVSPDLSLVCWQIISLTALILVAFVLGCVLPGSPGAAKIFWMSFLYFPIFHTLLIGQLGIPLGLLPLCGGYVLLRRRQEMLAGLIWSLLFLKLQFLPAAAFVAALLALSRRFQCLLSLLVGIAFQVAIGALITAPEVTLRWLDCLRLSDSTYSSSAYGPPTHLVICLPSAILMLLPMDYRDLAKIPIYGIAAALALLTLWRGHRLFRSPISDDVKLPMIMLLGLVLVPLIEPHFLSYDLTLLLLAGFIIYCEPGVPDLQSRSLRRLALLAWLAINLCLVVFLFVNRQYSQPVILALILLEVYRRTSRITTTLEPEPVPAKES